MNDQPTWNDTLVAEENIRALLRSRDEYRRRAIKAEMDLKRLRSIINILHNTAERTRR